MCDLWSKYVTTTLLEINMFDRAYPMLASHIIF
jgi:hypothetical protein